MLLASQVSATTVSQRDVATLPIRSLKAIQQSGEIIFMSDNGRFVIKGELFDLWTRQRVTDFAEMQQLATRLDLQKMQLDINALNTVLLGSGSKAVVIFITTGCPHSKRLIQISKPLTQQYRFQWVFIAEKGTSGRQQVNRILYHPSAEQALAAVADNQVDQLPVATNQENQRHQLTELTAHLLNVDQVPFLIAPDGRFHRGLPKDLAGWLAGKVKCSSLTN